MVQILLLVACLQGGLTAGEVKKLGGGMRFTEGPIDAPNGDIYFSDIPNSRIMRWDGTKLSTWRENSGRANGLRFDKEGNLYACEGGNRRVTKITPDQKVEVLADSYEGKKLNSPNDLAFDGKGGIYFTDPRYGNRDDMEMKIEGVYYIPPGGGKIIRVIDNFKRPNGIEMGKGILYVADAGGRKIWAFGVNKGGTLRGGRVFCNQGSDGMKLDERGNLYTTGGGVHIWAPNGRKIQTIKVPEGPANLCFGKKTLYITARTSLYAVPMRVGGFKPE